MGFGFGKGFIIILVIAVIVTIGTDNWKNGAMLVGVYAGVKIVWNILSK